MGTDQLDLKLKGQRYQHVLLLALFVIVCNCKGNIEDFSFVCVCLCALFFKIYVNCVLRFELVKSPEVTMCGWRGYNSV